MPFNIEFPDFDAATLPAIPAHWIDQSWKNDACPSFIIGESITVYIDYAKPDDREHPETPRFVLFNDEQDVLHTSDDWNDALVALIGERFAAVLREWLSPKDFAEMKRLNQTPAFAAGCCASHNYCDANMAMDQARRDILGDVDLDADNAEQVAQWNAAWDYARQHHIGCAP